MKTIAKPHKIKSHKILHKKEFKKTLSASTNAKIKTKAELLKEMPKLQPSLNKLLALGKQQGYVTYDQVNTILPAEITSSEKVEDVLKILTQKGIDVTAEAPEWRRQWENPQFRNLKFPTFGRQEGENGF